MSRPFKLSVNSDEDTSSDFKFNFLKNIDQEFIKDENYDNDTVRLRGTQFKNSNPTDNTCVVFGNVDYMFEAFIFTNDIDVELGNEGRFGIVVHLISRYGSNLFLQFQIIGSTDESYQNKFIDFVSKTTINNDINPDNWIDTGQLYYYYNLNNENKFVYFTEPLKSDSDTVESLKNDFVQNKRSVSSPGDIPIYKSITFPKKSDVNDFAFQDIYIDCSPMANDSDSKIIRPKEVFHVRPLFETGDMTDVSKYFIFIFIVFIIGLSVLLIMNNMLIPLGKEIANILKNLNSNGQSKEIGSTEKIIIFSQFVFIALILLLSSYYGSLLRNNNKNGRDSITAFVVIIPILFFIWFFVFLYFHVQKDLTKFKDGLHFFSYNESPTNTNIILFILGVFIVIGGLSFGVVHLIKPMLPEELRIDDPLFDVGLPFSLLCVVMVLGFQFKSTENKPILEKSKSSVKTSEY